MDNVKYLKAKLAKLNSEEVKFDSKKKKLLEIANRKEELSQRAWDKFYEAEDAMMAITTQWLDTEETLKRAIKNAKRAARRKNARNA